MKKSLFAVLACLAACNDSPKPAVPSAPPTAAAGLTAEDAVAAKEVFATRCTPCHGPNGAGDGPASAGLTPKPANFTTSEWQSKTADAHIEKIIVYGGLAVGKSAAMPPNPDLEQKANVVQALRAHLRSLKK